MSGFIEGESHHQTTMFPDKLDDFVIMDGAYAFSDEAIRKCIDGNELARPSVQYEASHQYNWCVGFDRCDNRIEADIAL